MTSSVHWASASVRASATAVTVTSLAAACAVLGATGCACGTPLEIDHPDSGLFRDVPDDARVISEEDVPTFAACATHDHTFSEDRLVAITSQLATREDGAVEVEVSDDGCVRFGRQITDGVLLRAEFFAFTGEILPVLFEGEVVLAARIVRLARWDRDEDGTLVGHIDHDRAIFQDHDDFAEVETIERDGYYRVSVASPASREVEWRLTIEERPAARIQTTERRQSGSLEVVDRTSLDLENELGGAPSLGECFAAATPCDATTTAALDTALARALARGTNCIAQLNDPRERYDADEWMRLQALKNLWTQGRSWACMPEGCAFAHWCEGCGAGGVDQIEIGYTDWTSLNEAQGLGTLFHEFMHGVIGGHLDVVVNSPIESPTNRRDLLMRRYVDRVDACEAYCFSSEPTACACATCLDVRTCDDRCAGLATCRYDDCSSGTCVPVMSEAVGAACVHVDDAGEESATWHATVEDCEMSGCAASGGVECRSYSRSCNAGCQ